MYYHLSTVWVFFFIYVLVSVRPKHMHVNTLKATRGHQSPGTGVTDGWESCDWMLESKLNLWETCEHLHR